MVNTNVKPVMCVTMQQRQQLLMCSVSRSYPLWCIDYFFYFSITIQPLTFLTFVSQTDFFIYSLHDSKASLEHSFLFHKKR